MDITALGGQVLLSADAATFKDLLEDAVSQHIFLEHADFRGRDLRNANLDGAKLPRACFDGADLTGANLSEALLSGASFENACLYETCFAESVLTRSSFCNARFAHTDFAYADLSHCLFEGPNISGVEWADTHTMEGSLFLWDGVPLPMSRPPKTIRSNRSRLLCLDRHILVNHRLIDRKEINSLKKLLRLMDRVLSKDQSIT
ncbi:MAG: pentapeptide repeat-containing protein [Pseudobdellovibrionaceae bacterium]